jgi:hypothetical protein
MGDTAPDPGGPCLFALDATSGEVFKTMLTGRMASEPMVADAAVTSAEGPHWKAFGAVR